MSALIRLGDAIDAFLPAEGAPPQRLGAFMNWCLRVPGRWLVLAGILSSLAGVTEVVSALILGWVVDAAVNTAPEGFFAAHWSLVLWFLAFYLVLRPLSFAVSSASNSIIIGPNVMPLFLSRLHRWTLGQAVTFFDNDFAGRIAQKQIAGRPLRDRCGDRGDQQRVCFALASVIGSVAFLVIVDARWPWHWRSVLAAYVALIRSFCDGAQEFGRAGSLSAMVSGQVVDTITNIKTVKLFAHAAFEDRVRWRDGGVSRPFAGFGVISTWFRFSLMLLAACCRFC